MDEEERKEKSSLPPDYVSLAQLQERWLQKQEEKKLKEKQEEEKKRVRDGRAQREKNQNQRGMRNDGRANMAGVILDKGKGKEVVTGGPGNGGENDKRREVIRGSGRRDFKRAAVVVGKVKVGVEAEELGGGVRCEGGRVEEVCNVSVVEVLPRNGEKEEIEDVKRTDLRGELRGNGRNRGSSRVNEFEQSEMGLDLEKKVEGERGLGENWRWREKERGRNGVYRERLNRLKEFKPVVLKGNKVDPEPEKKAEDEVSEVCGEISSLSVGDRNGIRGQNSKGSNKAKEGRVEGAGLNGDKMALEIEKKVDHEVLAVESAKIGENKGVVKGYHRNKNQRRHFRQERRCTRPEISAKEDRIEGEGSNGDKMALEIEKKADNEVLAWDIAKIGENRGVLKSYQRNENRRRDFGQERRYTRPEISAEEDDGIEGEGSNGNKVELEIEKKVYHEVLAGESAKIGENKVVVKGYRKNENERRGFAQDRRYTTPEILATQDRIEGEVLNGNKVALEIEKVDHEVLAGESAKIGENRGVVKGDWKNENQRRGFGRERRYPRPEISAKGDRIEGEGSNGVALEIEKKVGHEVLAGESAKIGESSRVVKGYPRNEIRRRWFGQERRYTRPEISAEEDRTEGEGSNGNKVAWIEKKVDHEVLAGENAKIGENRGVVMGYQRNENQRKRFGQERIYGRHEISDSWERMVWVKKEEKLGA